MFNYIFVSDKSDGLYFVIVNRKKNEKMKSSYNQNNKKMNIKIQNSRSIDKL